MSEQVIPYLLCECKNKHQFKLALPWYSFNIAKVKCKECGKGIVSVQFMGEIKQIKPKA